MNGLGDAVRPPWAGEAISISFNEAMDDISEADVDADGVPADSSRPRPFASPSKAVNDPPDRADPPKKPDPTRLGKYGVCAPLDRPFPFGPDWVPVDVREMMGGWSAWRDASRRRLVVPRAFVWDERAEQTRATRELGMYELRVSAEGAGRM